MTTAALSLGYKSIQHKIKNKIAFATHLKINWKLFYFMVVSLSLIMLVSYIFMVNQLIQGAYLIKNYNKDIAGLLKENKNFLANFAEVDFLGSVEYRAKELGFQKTTGVKYVEILQSSLAQAK